TSWVETGAIPIWDDFRPNDKFYVGDFDGDGRDDLFVFNALDWAIPYFAMLRSTGSGFETVHRYDLQLPGWDDMRQNDQFYVADFDADNRDDLYVFNGPDWNISYLEKLQSLRNTLVAGHRWDGNVPGWDDLKPHDQFFVADINGDRQ